MSWLVVGTECSRLLPPCWQELHYLFAGAWGGSIAGLLLGYCLATRYVVSRRAGAGGSP